MFFADNQIAEFRQSVYENDFGFDVSVYENHDKTLNVSSNNLLEDSYENFEEFLDDLIKKNPLWFTYYLVQIIPKHKELVKKKLSNSYRNIFNWLNMNVSATDCNWSFDGDGLGDFAKIEIDKILREENNFNFLSEEKPTLEKTSENWELGQMWNGFCPESWLNGKKVRMRLNRNDFFESEKTGLQIAVLRGVQAIILNFRGKGDFRTEITFADEIENGEMLSPQNIDYPPFNKPAEIFGTSEEIKNYINKIQ